MFMLEIFTICSLKKKILVRQIQSSTLQNLYICSDNLVILEINEYPIGKECLLASGFIYIF